MFRATTDDLAEVVSLREDMECALLRQAANAAPLAMEAMLAQVAPRCPPFNFLGTSRPSGPLCPGQLCPCHLELLCLPMLPPLCP